MILLHRQDNHGHVLLETLLPIFELIQTVWPELLAARDSPGFRVMLASRNDVTHPGAQNIPQPF